MKAKFSAERSEEVKEECGLTATDPRSSIRRAEAPGNSAEPSALGTRRREYSPRVTDMATSFIEPSIETVGAPKTHH